MTDKDKKNKKGLVVKEEPGNKCPVEEDGNCKMPGVFGDSSPIGGS